MYTEKQKKGVGQIHRLCLSVFKFKVIYGKSSEKCIQLGVDFDA